MGIAHTQQQVGAQVRQLEGDARRAVRKASPWVVRLGRAGLVAKGMVYLIIGWLAFQAAFSHRGDVADQRDALTSVLHQPFGAVLLGVLAVGLLGYMVWRFMQALLNPEREEHDLKGWSKRVFRFVSGLIYGGLGVAAARLLVGMQTAQRTPADWTAMIMRQPFGKWLVVAGGLGILGYGVLRIWKAIKGELKKQLVLDGMAARARQWILGLGRLGQAARGVVFAITGGFAAAAGWHANPSEAKGLGEALRTIGDAPYGPYLLGAVAAGLIAYGLFQFIEARYRRIRAE